MFPVAACIPATLTLFKGPDSRQPVATFSVTVETPAWVRPYPVPAVGTVTMGSVCGASTVDQSPSESDNTQTIIQALSKAATDINNAVKAKTQAQKALPFGGID